ncbi:unnamed protein product [Rhodiola kirilowii]
MAASDKKIILKCSDGQTFEVEEAIAIQSQTIKCTIEDDCAHNTIPVPNVTGKIMSMVLEYCNKHAEYASVAESSAGESSSSDAPSADVDDDADSKFIKNWDAKFVNNVDLFVLFELIQAANYLNIQKLLDLTTQAVANKIRDKMPEEIREIFSIENDFTPEEEEQLRKENAWAYEV